MLSITGLSKTFVGKAALRDVSVDIPKGTFLGVVGRSGAGKSTLLRCINRLAEPSAGKIMWDGKDVTALKGAELRQWRANCGMVFQQFNLSGRLDV